MPKYKEMQKQIILFCRTNEDFRKFVLDTVEEQR